MLFNEAKVLKNNNKVQKGAGRGSAIRAGRVRTGRIYTNKKDRTTAETHRTRMGTR